MTAINADDESGLLYTVEDATARALRDELDVEGNVDAALRSAVLAGSADGSEEG